MAIKDQGNTTLHQRILGDIEGRILSGEWPPGHHLPFEMDIAAQYGCSRMTVNKVMGELVKSGLIERRRKSGTFVSPPRSQSAVLEIRDIRDEVESLGLEYGYRLFSRTVRESTASDERRLGLSGKTTIVDLLCIHLADQQPFCVEQRVIDVNVVQAAGDFDFLSVPPGRWLVGSYPWSVGEHRIYAMPVGLPVSRHLSVRSGTACLVVERQTWLGDVSVTHVVLTYPGDRHRLIAQFRP